MPLRTNARSFNLAQKVLTWSSRCNFTLRFMFCLFFVLYMYSVRIYSQGGVLPNKEVRGACRLTSGLEAKFGVRSGQVHKIRGKIWEVLSPKDTEVGKKYQFWGQYLKFRGQNLGYLSFILWRQIWGSTKNFRGKIWGQAPPDLLIWKYPPGNLLRV